jgi:hypothetical protein
VTFRQFFEKICVQKNMCNIFQKKMRPTPKFFRPNCKISPNLVTVVGGTDSRGFLFYAGCQAAAARGLSGLIFAGSGGAWASYFWLGLLRD